MDALARVVPHVGDEPIAGSGHALALGDPPSTGEHMAKEGVVFARQSLGALDVFLGDDEHVDRRLGRDVPKGETGRIETGFESVAARRFVNVETDISGLTDTSGIIRAISEKIEGSGATAEDCVRVVLKGKTDIEAEKDEALIEKTFEGKYCLFRLYDESSFAIDYESYAADKSLKGEFIRLIKNDPSISEEKKAETIRYGIRALLGEDILG